jgi:hypothetical protein
MLALSLGGFKVTGNRVIRQNAGTVMILFEIEVRAGERMEFQMLQKRSAPYELLARLHPTSQSRIL